MPVFLQKNPRQISACPRKISGNLGGHTGGEYCVEYLSRAIANGNHRRICCLKNSLITNLRPRQEVNVSRSERENQIRPSSRHVPKHGAARCPDESLDSREISGI
ncbi:hypothetical protein HN011_002694 [Eciton burchellii]|nr:hypothetical protein HN011_002694 [Eciton burchellii]